MNIKIKKHANVWWKLYKWLKKCEKRYILKIDINKVLEKRYFIKLGDDTFAKIYIKKINRVEKQQI